MADDITSRPKKFIAEISNEFDSKKSKLLGCVSTKKANSTADVILPKKRAVLTRKFRYTISKGVFDEKVKIQR